MAPSYPYPYPVTNSELIRLHKLESHLEGGFFAETAVLASQPSKTAPQLPPGLAANATNALDGKAQVSWGAGAQLLGGQSAPSTAEGTKVEATQIYYLLTADSYRGKMHFNLHAVSLSPGFSRRRPWPLLILRNVALSPLALRPLPVHPHQAADIPRRDPRGPPHHHGPRRRCRGGLPAVRSRRMVESQRDPRGGQAASRCARHRGPQGAHRLPRQRDCRTRLESRPALVHRRGQGGSRVREM
jgi:hypothetical protein